MKICVLGLGYIGLPTAALMAKAGHEVVGADVNPKTVDAINAGHIQIIENGLEQLVSEVVKAGRLRAQSMPCEADAFIVAVPTPVREDANHTPELKYVDAAAQSIAPHVKPGDMVILESTSPVGTTERIADEIAKCGVDVSKVLFAHCPERVIPGRALVELTGNDRIIGGLTPEATKAVKTLYATFVKGELLETNSRTAEMAKLVENSFRDVNIAFANELSMICSDIGIDTMELIRLANHHPRVNILTPGCGVGGHCIAVDPWFVVSRSPERAKLIRCAREVNDFKSDWVVGKVREACKAFGKSRPKIALLGLAFKPDTDDLRGSPAVKIAAKLTAESSAEWMVVEPNISAHPQFNLTPCEEAIAQADLIVALVRHSKFKGLVGRKPTARILNFCDLETSVDVKADGCVGVVKTKSEPEARLTEVQKRLDGEIAWSKYYRREAVAAFSAVHAELLSAQNQLLSAQKQIESLEKKYNALSTSKLGRLTLFYWRIKDRLKGKRA